MWKIILVIAVFGVPQLTGAWVLPSFRSNQTIKTNQTNKLYEEDLKDFKDENTNGQWTTLRSFQETPFLYFNGSVQTEDEPLKTRCEERWANPLCAEFELVDVNCTNTNYQKVPEPKWKCAYRFYEKGFRNLLISDFRIECVDCLQPNNCLPHHYEEGTCDYAFGVKLDERPFSEIANEREIPDPNGDLEDPESHGLLIAAIILAGSSFFVLFVVIICACIHAMRESRQDHPVDDLDLCPGCGAAGGNCDCCNTCGTYPVTDGGVGNGDCCGNCGATGGDCGCCAGCGATGGECDCCAGCGEACGDACLTGCFHGIFDVCFDACASGCLEAFCEGCCQCVGTVLVEGIASSSFR